MDFVVHSKGPVYQVGTPDHSYFFQVDTVYDDEVWLRDPTGTITISNLDKIPENISSMLTYALEHVSDLDQSIQAQVRNVITGILGRSNETSAAFLNFAA